MASFEMFIKKMKKEMGERFGSAYTIEVQNVLKNNGVRKTGLMVKRDGKTASPVIYLDAYYEAYQEGRSMKEMINEVYDMYNTFERQDIPLEMLKDFENMKDKVYYKLVNYENNKKSLENMPHMRYLDLAVTFGILIERSRNGQMTTQIENKQMRYWGMDAESLYDLAEENTPRLFPSSLESMPDVLKKIIKEHMGSGYDEELFGDLLPAQTENPMFILGNTSGVNGAAVILYKNVLKDFAEAEKTDLVILPCSVHETLLIPYDGEADMKDFKEMVMHINRTEVPKDEVLSDSVYLYKRESDKIYLAL